MIVKDLGQVVEAAKAFARGEVAYDLSAPIKLPPPQTRSRW
jgi:hypothetical protein